MAKDSLIVVPRRQTITNRIKADRYVLNRSLHFQFLQKKNYMSTFCNLQVFSVDGVKRIGRNSQVPWSPVLRRTPDMSIKALKYWGRVVWLVCWWPLTPVLVYSDGYVLIISARKGSRMKDRTSSTNIHFLAGAKDWLSVAVETRLRVNKHVINCWVGISASACLCVSKWNPFVFPMNNGCEREPFEAPRQTLTLIVLRCGH